MTKRDVRQEYGHRVRRIIRVGTTAKGTTRGVYRHCRGLATKRTGRTRIKRDHWPIASRRLVRPRSRRATFVVSAASLSRIRSARRSRRDFSLSISRRRSAPSKALRARTKHRCASTARSRSNFRAIAEKEVPVSRRARACASSCGAESRCLRGDPPRTGLDDDRLLERGPCVCLGTAKPPTQPRRGRSRAARCRGSVRIGPTRVISNGPRRQNANDVYRLPAQIAKGRQSRYGVVLSFGNPREAGRRQSLRGASRGPAVRRGMTQLRHGPRLDLADPLTGEPEEDPDLFEGTRLAPVETEAQS